MQTEKGDPLVHLSKEDYLFSIAAGRARQDENTKDHNRQAAKGASEDPAEALKLHETGCLGETALARWLGVDPPGKGTFRKVDVDGKECKASEHVHGHLILTDADRDDPAFYLLTGAGVRWWVRGWIFGDWAKEGRFWFRQSHNGRPPAHWIPQWALVSHRVDPEAVRKPINHKHDRAKNRKNKAGEEVENPRPDPGRIRV